MIFRWAHFEFTTDVVIGNGWSRNNDSIERERNQFLPSIEDSSMNST